MRTDLLKSLLPLAHDPLQVDNIKDPDDYPHVENWVGGLLELDVRVGKKVNFLVDEDGDIADEGHIKIMHEELKGIFQQILKFMPYILEEQWEKSDLSFRQTICTSNSLNSRFAVITGKPIHL